MLSLILVGASGPLRSPVLLWGGTAMVGMCCGPLWPASMSLLTEMYGVQLSTTQVAATQVLTKLSIAGEQWFFSVILSDAKTAPLFVHSCAAILLIAGLAHFGMSAMTSKAGLRLTERAIADAARPSAWDRFVVWVASL